MGAIVNGLGLEGLRAYGGTFLTFSDYMRGAVRLAALMKLPSIWVWTHDSIGLGEDGPTHQPVEHLCALRAIPRLNVLRPADANETALGWRFALRQTEAPTRVRAVAPERADARPRLRARRRDRARRVRPAGTPATATPDVILIGHGLRGGALPRGRREARGDGVAVRVVSHAVHGHLQRAGRDVPRLGAAARRAGRGWPSRRRARWAGTSGSAPDGAFLGMTTFGESGPAPDVYEHFGITAEAAAELCEPFDRVGGGCDERHGWCERAARRAHRGGDERLARPDPPQPDRGRRAAAADRRGCRCAASRRTRRSSRRRSSAPTTTTTSCASWPSRAATRRRSTSASR